ncbi:hypothetical protein AVEN_39200-1 [Araneus ventricosus]|uniref:Uncharacterized protein n=1 Tax=Araneus ventricosus TaxID=182803 RepID=A0A4Y2PW92_ARAVE|nr:hypothetical protein AVEN_39200-1 [Araneus ventricosus]
MYSVSRDLLACWGWEKPYHSPSSRESNPCGYDLIRRMKEPLGSNYWRNVSGILKAMDCFIGTINRYSTTSFQVFYDFISGILRLHFRYSTTSFQVFYDFLIAGKWLYTMHVTTSASSEETHFKQIPMYRQLLLCR